MAFKIHSGAPGSSFTNGTGKILWQLKVQFANSCARCIQYAGQIGPFWPLPYHPRCNCTNIPVYPGETAEPFIDFVKEVEALDPHQQAKVMGASNWKLVQSGKVAWTDVVKPNRILTFGEVAVAKSLSVDQCVGAGIGRYHAEAAVAKLKDSQAADIGRAELLKKLLEHGISPSDLKAAFVARMMEKVGLAGGPSGPTGFTPPTGPKPRPIPPGLPAAVTVKLLTPPLTVKPAMTVPAHVARKYPEATVVGESLAGLPEPGTSISESATADKAGQVIRIRFSDGSEYLIPAGRLDEVLDHLYPDRDKRQDLTDAEIRELIRRKLNLKGTA